MAKHPNILYLNSHDTGRWLGCYGASVKTPNLDALAARGVLCENMFSMSPTCSPSRSSMLTGQTPHSLGVLGNVGRGFQMNAPEHHLAHYLGKQGYRTAHIGISSIAPIEPIGYDDNLGGYEEAETLAADYFAQCSGQEQPFFLDIGFMETHRLPSRCHTDFYKASGFNSEPHVEWLKPLEHFDLDAEGIRADLEDFATSVASLDARVGRVLQALECAGLAEDTLIIYTTDHGPAFPGMKATLSDRGLGVATLFCGPADSALLGGRRCSSLLSQIGVFPTLCDFLGLPRPDWLEGDSFLPALTGENVVGEEAVFAEMTYHAAYEPLRAVRTAQWKYIRAFHDYERVVLANIDDGSAKSALYNAGKLDESQAGERLYNLTVDPGERHNLAADPAHTEALSAMRVRLNDWMRSTADPLLDGPIPLPEGIRPVSPAAYSPWDGR